MTNQLYKIGDKCIGMNFHENSIFNNLECVIKGDMLTRQGRIIRNGKETIETYVDCYLVDWANGFKSSIISQDKLRLKPKFTELSTWEEIKHISGYVPPTTNKGS